MLLIFLLSGSVILCSAGLGIILFGERLHASNRVRLAAGFGTIILGVVLLHILSFGLV